jgi:hypothetical protein
MSPSFLGSNYSKYEERILNTKVNSQELIQAIQNPLVEALNSTQTQMIFSKPYYHTVYDSQNKVDIEKSHHISLIFDNIDFLEWAMVAEGEAFTSGIGPAEMSYDKNPETGWVEWNGMSRRPADSFINPKDPSIRSTSQRWKGIFYQDGVLHFDQTQIYGKKYNEIVSLNPDQMFYIRSALARFPDGPGCLESLIPILDSVQYCFNLSYVVMAEQINPKEVYEKENMGSSDGPIVQRIVNNNGVETSLIPADKQVEHPHYYDRQDILEFFKFFEHLMYRIVFPISALATGDGGGILDNSSNIAKESIFFSYIDFHRQKLCREINKKGNFLLDLNGFKKQGYTYQCVPAPVVPRNIEVERHIMADLAKLNYFTPSEVRSWVNSSVSGIKLEDQFDESQVGVKVQPKTLDPNLQKKISNIAQGSADLESLWEETEQRIKDGERKISQIALDNSEMKSEWKRIQKRLKE